MGKLVQIGAQKSIGSEKKDTKSKGRLVPIDTSSANNPFRRMISYAESALQMGRESQAETTPSPSLPEREPVTLATGRTGSFRPAAGGSMQQRPIQIDLSTARRETPPAYDPVERAKIDEAYREQIKQNIVVHHAGTREGLGGGGGRGGVHGAGAITSTLAAGEDLLLGALGQPDAEGPLQALNRRMQEGAQRNEAYFAPAFEESGSIGNVLETFGIPTVAAIPQAALAFLTAGSSLGAQGTTAGLQAASTAAQSGLGTSILNGIRTMARQPNYWLSFAQGAGNDYYEAKERGESDLTALAYSTLTNLLNSAVEVGGGIDVLPRQLQSAAQGGKGAVLDWVKSMFDEGREEVIQGAITQLTENVVLGAENPLYSGTDQNAVLNPSRAGQEFLGGAVAGGLLGAGQALVNSAINRNGGTRSSAGAQEAAIPVSQDTRAETAPQATEMPVMDAEVQRLFGQQNVAPNTEAADVPLRERVRSSIPALQEMSPVSVLDGTEIPRGGRMIDRLVSFVNSIGNRVNRPGFGDVLFSRGRIKNSMIGHGVGQAKIDTFAAVPDVIRNGQQIDYQKNWKGRNYDTYTFAAPINYKGQETYLGVIVTKDSASNRYYLHEVVDADGNIIFTNNESPVSTSDGTSALAGDLDTVADTGDGAGDSLGTVDTVTDGRASQENSASVEGTRPLNSDSTIPQRADSVNDVMGREAARLFGSAPYEGGRVPQSTMTEGQIDRLAQEWEQGTAGLDAAGNAFRADPAEHIDRRTAESVGSRQVNAFQFDWPELHSYMQQAARDLLTDADVSLQMPQTRRMERTTGGRRYTQNITESQQLRSAMDMGLTRDQIITAAERLIADSGQENYAAAKRLELVLDDMLTNGYRTISGETVGPNQDYIQAKNRIAGAEPRAEAAEELPLGDVPNGRFYDSLGSAREGFTGAGLEGTERVSRLADSLPYNRFQEEATGLSKEDYARLFRYESQTEGRSMQLAEELLYYMQDGQRTFLRDIDEEAYRSLVQSLDESTAWNAPQMDAARMIQSELQRRSANLEIPETEYIDFLKMMREHETATGQGVQANAKWSRTDNAGGQASELEAWENLENSDLSEAEKAQRFQQIVRWDTQIEGVPDGDTQALKDIILEVAQERGTLSGLSGRQSRALYSIASNSLDALTFDQLKQFAYASTSALSQDSAPVSIGRKVKTVQILNMLSNPKTAAKNILGNTTFYGLDALAMRGAAVLDAALSRITGTRSVAAGGTSLTDAVKAMQMAIAEITMDVNMDSGESRYGTSSRRTFKASGNLAERVLSMLERNQAYLLNATDEFYKGAARSTQERTQALVDQGRIRTDNPNYAQEQAEQLARYRTFQDDSTLSGWLQDIHDMFNVIGVGDSGRTRPNGKTIHDFGLGDIIAPFTRVAGNLASRGLEYSPVNAVKGTVEIVREVARAASGGTVDPSVQAKAVSNTARGLTGTAIAYGFMLLAQAGLLRQADDENDENVAALNQAEGITGTQLNLSAAERWLSGGSAAWQNGDTLIDLSSIEPLNLLMNLGTEMAKDEQSPIVTAFNATSDAFMDATAELPVMQFIGNAATNIIRYGQNPREVLLQEGANTIASSLIPNILRSTARGLDDRPRNTYSGDTFLDDVVANIQNSIPGLRETLPGSVDTFGEDRTYQGDLGTRLINALLNPVGVNTYTQSEVSREMEQVREETGDTSFYPTKSIPSELSYTEDGVTHKVSLDYEQRQDFQRERGTTSFLTMSDMMGTSAYRSASAEEKSALLDLCGDYAYQVAKESVLGSDAVPEWVGNAQNARRDLGISTAEYLAYYNKYSDRGFLSGSGYEKLKEAVANGLTIDEYAAYRDATAGLSADKDEDGKTISGSKKEKVLSAIDGMDLSDEEKDGLYYLNGYAESGIDEAPWRRRR